jgi:hypothetical protein
LIGALRTHFRVAALGERACELLKELTWNRSSQTRLVACGALEVLVLVLSFWAAPGGTPPPHTGGAPAALRACAPAASAGGKGAAAGGGVGGASEQTGGGADVWVLRQALDVLWRVCHHHPENCRAVVEASFVGQVATSASGMGRGKGGGEDGEDGEGWEEQGRGGGAQGGEGSGHLSDARAGDAGDRRLLESLVRVRFHV